MSSRGGLSDDIMFVSFVNALAVGATCNSSMRSKSKKHSQEGREGVSAKGEEQSGRSSSLSSRPNWRDSSSRHTWKASSFLRPR
jgi:hypothetical protein